MEIRRKIEPLLQEYLTVFPIVGIIGPRQVGKTTLAKNLSVPSKIHYLDLEATGDRQKLSDPVMYLANHEDKLVVLDEIQNMPELFAALRGIVDANRRVGRFIILGSASPALIKKSADSLAGRVGYIELSPLMLSEINFEKENELWVRGGFPLSFLANTDRGSLIWRKNFIKTYIEKDLAMLGLSAEAQVIERFWRILASMHGNLWNAESIGRTMGLTHTTVNRYLDFMEGAFLIRRLQPYFTNISKRLVKSPKIYLRDSGILHAFKDIASFSQLIEDAQIGASWEGFVIEQIINEIEDRAQYYFYRTHQGTECDLLLVKNERVMAAIEIKYSSAPTISKSFRVTLEDTKAENAFVVAKVNETYWVDKTICVLTLKDFIQNYLPKIL